MINRQAYEMSNNRYEIQEIMRVVTDCSKHSMFVFAWDKGKCACLVSTTAHTGTRMS